MKRPEPGRRSWLASLAALGVAVVTLAALALSGPGPGPPADPPAPPAPTSPVLGISVNRLFNGNTFSAAQISAALQALAATGATDARSDSLWEASEPSPPAHARHHYDWTFDDRIALALAQHGLRWLPIIDYTVWWAESIPGQDHSPPKYPLDYAAYAAAFAGRYGSGGTFWRLHPRLSPRPVQTLEIWNEPDGGIFWLPGPNPPAYANLYADTRQAVKALDPAMRVIIGGLGHPVAFLPAVLRARPDMRGHIDGVGVHPYASNPMTMLVRLQTDRRLLERLGLARVPLYATEFGWTSHPRGALNYLPEALRPGYISATMSAFAHTNCVVAGIFLYTWVTPERNRGVSDDWFGIHPPGGGSTASQRAFTDGIAAARHARAPLRVC